MKRHISCEKRVRGFSEQTEARRHWVRLGDMGGGPGTGGARVLRLLLSQASGTRLGACHLGERACHSLLPRTKEKTPV